MGLTKDDRDYLDGKISLQEYYRRLQKEERREKNAPKGVAKKHKPASQPAFLI